MKTYQCKYCGRIGHNYIRAEGETWYCTNGNACAERSLRRMKERERAEVERLLPPRTDPERPA